MGDSFHEWLRGELSRRGWQQKDLARVVGVSQQTASRWLLGQATPTARSVRALATTLGVPTDELLGRLGTAEREGPGGPDAGRSTLDAELTALRRRVEQLEAQLARRRQA